jgi:hypothetical protein
LPIGVVAKAALRRARNADMVNDGWNLYCLR